MPYCNRCDRYFNSYYALNQHKRDSSFHWICDDCGIDFSTSAGRKEHYVQSPRHDYCQRCDELFDDEEELEDHYDEVHHWCRHCHMFFKNQYGLQEHYRQSPSHYYCSPCDRHFLSASNLRSHVNSSIHQPRNYTCPFKGCGYAFVSQSALTQHLEAGTCSSGVNRNTVNRIVRKYDTTNIITDPSRMITIGDAYQERKLIATGAAWNGEAYECYLCHSTYRTLSALNQHLSSPRHEDKMYICPLNTCRSRFSCLSSLVQHIESEYCGVSKFKSVQNAMDNIIGQMKRITF
ncbi:hypothetical protein AMATHDRAFT_62436 [Amanita thiersii Skay4041]|uniref:C2H2-type domain-containing protein n=1 Tax=Amanita thiersii Skay4041 TaxID=703135 RepID=A0A2A9NN99_9AGAR|nr:hypothetical protein AMATHDRAFT_62436 [Amanita thiersii Skay4041]